MLKRTKSASQSVIGDARDDVDNALSGCAQPDEDDYGYVSQEASAFYNKLMEKYSKMPNEPKFNLNKKKKVSTNLTSTKDRVRAALEKEREEASMPHKRKRKHKDATLGDIVDAEDDVDSKSIDSGAPPPPKKKPKAPAPPPINFADLLKIAEKKQFEPIVIEQKVKEEEKLLTKKQKKEMEREKEWRDRKEGRVPAMSSGPAWDKSKMNSSASKSSSSKIVPPPPSLSERKDVVANKNNSDPGDKKITSNNGKLDRNNVPSKSLPTNNKQTTASNNCSNNISKGANKVVSGKVNKDQDLIKRKNLVTSSSSTNNNHNNNNNKSSNKELVKPPNHQDHLKRALLNNKPNNKQQLPTRDLKAKQQIQPPRTDLFPQKRKPSLVANKGRILDDDDEDYDSEMDDFIDDGPDEEEDYSKHINEIFGYDKSRYRHLDDDVDNMESTFAQQMREEVISTKIGIMEDLEDMKKEEEEKRRKALMKKKMK